MAETNVSGAREAQRPGGGEAAPQLDPLVAGPTVELGDEAEARKQMGGPTLDAPGAVEQRRVAHRLAAIGDEPELGEHDPMTLDELAGVRVRDVSLGERFLESSTSRAAR